MQLIVIYCCVILIARNMASKPATLLALQLVPSAVLGASLALAVEYITLAANGGHYLDTVTKVRVVASALDECHHNSNNSRLCHIRCDVRRQLYCWR